MPVIPITVFFSLGLVFLFVALFWREQRRPGVSAERDSLLPLADEFPRILPRPAGTRAGFPPEPPSAPAGPARTDDTPGSTPTDCGCDTGPRPSCARCLHRPAAA